MVNTSPTQALPSNEPDCFNAELQSNFQFRITYFCFLQCVTGIQKIHSDWNSANLSVGDRERRQNGSNSCIHTHTKTNVILAF
jgi:hypothetical protein